MARFVGAVASGSDVHESLDAFFFFWCVCLGFIASEAKRKKMFSCPEAAIGWLIRVRQMT